MEKIDIKAHIDTLGELVTALTRVQTTPERAMVYVAIRTLLADLDEIAEAGDYAAETIGETLAEIEFNCQALAGLMPSQRREETEHAFLANNNLLKLRGPSMFALDDITGL